ncbi:MAG: DUF2804 domain-containing protein [Ruminococcaceae bacterium]|nr:DUF2804 domain-containing protein [Oscillospiraceae bacterium]
MQHKLTPGPLLDEQGKLCECGYATSLVKQYDRNAIKAPKFRIKEWDYYLITANDFAFAMTIDDNSYMGQESASVLDFTDKDNPWEHTSGIIKFFTNGKIGMPSTSEIGDVAYDSKKVKLKVTNDGKTRHLTCHYKNFDGKNDLDMDIVLTDFPEDSMVAAVPWKNHPRHFYYNQKIIGMKATGTVAFRGKTYTLDESNNAFGLLDWGRGVWTYDNTWYWGAGQTRLPDGHTFGFNIGYGFGDTSAASENMLFYDGKAHKLEEVSFNIPKTADGKDDFMAPWTFTSSDGRFEMDFIPILDRAANITVGPLGSDQHQVFGHFSGTAILDDGTKLEIKDMLGFAEKVRNKW